MDQGEKWTPEAVARWVRSQVGQDYWYQTIPVKYGIVTPGTVDSRERLELLGLPQDLSGKTVLDVGCNSGMLALECKRRGADRVVGIDLQRNRLAQARTLAEIIGLDIEFIEMDAIDIRVLGQFDIVFCIAVLTEVADFIGTFSALMEVTSDVLYLETATMETFPRYLPAMGRSLQRLLHLSLVDVYDLVSSRIFHARSHQLLCGTAKLRQIDSRLVQGWSLVPNRHFLDSLTRSQFEMRDLGMSTRYNLFRFDRRQRTLNEDS